MMYIVVVCTRRVSPSCILSLCARGESNHDVYLTSGYLDLVQRLEFGVDHLQKNAVYQIE